MKQKYEILKDDDSRRFIIREYAELDKDVMSLLCEESYDRKTLKAAQAAGRDALIRALRTKNLFPPSLYAARIADQVAEMLGSRGPATAELVFDDLEFLSRAPETLEAAVVYEAEAPEIDELLDAGLEEEKFDQGEEVGKIDSSLKIEDDEFVDIDDES
ncbi:MAG: hypothetical protein WHT06_08070 [Desulfobacterales bacterium]